MGLESRKTFFTTKFSISAFVFDFMLTNLCLYVCMHFHCMQVHLEAIGRNLWLGQICAPVELPRKDHGGYEVFFRRGLLHRSASCWFLCGCWVHRESEVSNQFKTISCSTFLYICCCHKSSKVLNSRRPHIGISVR